MADLDITPGELHGVELGGKKYVAEKPVGLGTFLNSTTYDGYTLAFLLAAGYDAVKGPGHAVMPTKGVLDGLGGGVGWWFSWPTQA